ncbi:DUF4363 family protein [Evansella clarkii]|uniref:DUF4363 family protein n=1 Tax=Evansella clarkii TaxID=79879 RepID=UPI000B446F2C|nr:DUF4363 family protein [Evansella clarkii]
MKVLTNRLFLTFLTALIIAIGSWLHTSYENADNPLSRQAETVWHLVEEENWEEAEKEAEILWEMFEDKRWRMEFFGPVEHVTVARYKVVSLMEAVKSRNDETSLELLAKLKARFDEFVIF